MLAMRTELYWIEGPWTGRLAIMPRPRGGDWLEDEIASWRRVGIDTIVSALTEEESTELDLGREQELCEGVGVDFIAFPIMDRGLPSSVNETLELVLQLEQGLGQGKKIAIHCRQGIGRASLLAACVFAAGGVDATTAFERIAIARGCAVPDTSEQRKWVTRFAHSPDCLAKSVAQPRELGIDPESP
jgi:protein-tyrosine phosphatase